MSAGWRLRLWKHKEEGAGLNTEGKVQEVKESGAKMSRPGT